MTTRTVANRRKADHQSEAQRQCKHHWVIESADDRVSGGVCKLCGARKEFKNFLPDCIGTSQEEYEEWLVKQKDYAKAGRMRADPPSERGGD